jgi:extradiol dioxygenase family protein
MTAPPINVLSLHVSVPVLDLAEAESFYRDAFGAQTDARTDDLATMSVRGHRLALRRVTLESDSLQKGGADRLRSRHFGFGVSTPDEVDEAVQPLTGLGAKLVVPPADRVDGRSAIFCDRSGNQLEIYYQEVRDG